MSHYLFLQLQFLKLKELYSSFAFESLDSNCQNLPIICLENVSLIQI